MTMEQNHATLMKFDWLNEKLAEEHAEDDDLDNVELENPNFLEKEPSDGEISKLIQEFLSLQTKKHFLHYLLNEPKENWPQFQQVEVELNDAKNSYDESEEKLAKVLENIDKATSSISETANVDEVFEATNLLEKETHRDHLLCEYREAFGEQQPLPLSEILSEIATTGEVFESVSKEKASLKREVENLEKETKHIESETAKLACQQQLPGRKSSHKFASAENNEETTSETDWVLLATGASKLKWDHSKSQLTAFYTASTNKTANLAVKICFDKLPNGDNVVKSVQIENAPSNITNWAEKQVANRPELGLFLLELYKEWKNEIPLVLEIEQLRARYGVDWIPESRELHMIFGEGTTVELCVGENYPRTGSVSVKKLRGRGSSSVDLEDISVEGKRSLTEWIAYLKQKLEH